jgi:hypothetical protein
MRSERVTGVIFGRSRDLGQAIWVKAVTPLGEGRNAWAFRCALAVTLTVLLIVYGNVVGLSKLVLAMEASGHRVLMLFEVFFYIWVAMLLVLLHGTERGEGRPWAALFIVCIYSLGFLGFWIIGTPQGRHSDEWLTMAQARLILDRGRIDVPNPNPDYAYLYHPGTQTIAAILGVVCGEALPTVRRLLLLTTGTAFVSLLFVWQRKLLHSSLMAGLGSLVFITGNPYATKTYVLFPGHIGQILLLLYFVSIFGKRPFSGSSSRDLLLPGLIFGAMTVTHLMSSVLALTTTYLFLILAWRKEESSNGRRLAVLATVLFLTWQISNAYSISSLAGLVLGMFRFLGHIGAILSLARMTVGTKAPLWARVNMLFWIGSIYIVGSAVACRTSLQYRTATNAQKMELVGLASCLWIAIFAGIASPGGSQLLRLLQWIPLFSVSALLRSLAARRQALALATMLFAAFSLTSFVQFDSNVPADSFSSQEVRSGEFLERTAATYGAATYITGVYVRPLYQYYLGPVFILSEPEYTYYRDARGAFHAIDDLVAQFHATQGRADFILDDRMIIQYLRLYQLERSDPRWQSLATLSRHQLVYSNGTVELFSAGSQSEASGHPRII